MTTEEHELCGLFWGEGCVSVSKTKQHSGGYWYMGSIQISARDDDRGNLTWIQENFGGNLSQNAHGRNIIGYKGRTYRQNPSSVWYVRKRTECLRIVEMLLQGHMPSKKKQELVLFKEFLELKTRGKRQGYQGKWYTEEELARQDEICKALSQLKKFNVK